MLLPERAAHLRRLFLSGDHRPRNGRDGSRRHGGRTGPHHAGEAGHADATLPHAGQGPGRDGSAGGSDAGGIQRQDRRTRNAARETGSRARPDHGPARGRPAGCAAHHPAQRRQSQEGDRSEEFMKLHQLALFLENKLGHLLDPCKRLASAGINIRTLSVADTQQFGILRLIVSDWQKARDVLQDAGYVTTATEVVAVEVPDRPGGLAEVLDALETCEINIEYMYAFTFGRAGRAVIIFRFDKPDEAITRLQASGINVVESIEVYNRIEA